MEEDKSGLDILISQRLHRPNLSRMISWEIEKAEPNGSSSKQRKKAKQKQNQGSASSDDGECSGRHGSDLESDGSEYYSAEEFFISSDSESSSADSPTVSLSDLDLTDDKLKVDKPDTDLDKPDEKGNGERKRAPSKKQKRRHREQLKGFADYAIPFRNVEHIDLDASDLFEFCPTDVSISRCVPSLFQLAIHSLWRKPTKTSSQSYTKLPSVMKTAVSDLQRGQSFASIQLSLLYRFLADAEKNIDTFLTWEYCYKKKIYKVEFVMRNVWSYNYFDKQRPTDFVGHSSTAWLPFTYFGFRQLYSNPLDSNVLQIALISILSAVMDLMLPRNISKARYSRCRRQSRSEADCVKKITLSLLGFVRDSLRKRYPEVVKYVFDWAVPYFHWARGNVVLAAEAFLQLSQNVEDVYRACLLSEAARLYCLHDQPDMASHLYREAANVMVDSVSLDDSAVGEISAQRFALMADINDQGAMTSLKAHEAASTWKSVLKFVKNVLPGLGSRAIESLLCFHAGSRQGVSDADVLKEALELASPQVLSDMPYLYLHLSLIHALLGNEAQSLEEYKKFSMYFYSGDSVPGSFMKEISQMKFNPWKYILEHTVTGGALQLIPVAWRTQLGHMRIVSDENSFDGDFGSYPDLHLTMTSDGFLSADLQMVLPSIRNLKLDPYTGSPVYDQLSRVNFPWHSLDFLHEEKHSYNSYFLTPTTVELYQDEAGNRVYILCPDLNMVENTQYLNKLITLYWTGPGHQKAKLNLFSRLRKTCYEGAVQHIRDNIDSVYAKTKCRLYMTKEEYLTTYVKVLHICFEREWSYDFYNVDKLICEITIQIKPRRSRKTSKKEKSNKTKNPLGINKQSRLSMFKVRIEHYVTYQHTLFMLFSTSSSNRCMAFMDCSSKENFLSPKITFDPDVMYNASYTEMFPQAVRHVLPCSQIMWHSDTILENGRHTQACCIYGQKGELLKITYPHKEDFRPQTKTFTRTPLVLGRKLYGTTDDKLCLMCDDLSDNLTFSDPLPEVKNLSVIADKLMVVTAKGLSIFDPSSLQPCPITVECKSCSLALSDEHNCVVGVESAKIVGTKLISDGPVPTQRVALSVDNHLLILDFTQSVQIIMCTALSGIPMEVCFVGKSKLLVSCTLHQDSASFYREHLYQLSYSGRLLAVLPFLGPGPRCFLPVHLPACEEAAAVDPRLGRAGWRVFMRDGHEGILSVLINL